jgi:hypothetical protein
LRCFLAILYQRTGDTQWRDLVRLVTDPVFLGGPVGWQLHGVAGVQWALNAIETEEMAKPWLPLREQSR